MSIHSANSSLIKRISLSQLDSSAPLSKKATFHALIRNESNTLSNRDAPVGLHFFMFQQSLR